MRKQGVADAGLVTKLPDDFDCEHQRPTAGIDVGHGTTAAIPRAGRGGGHLTDDPASGSPCSPCGQLARTAGRSGCWTSCRCRRAGAPRRTGCPAGRGGAVRTKGDGELLDRPRWPGCSRHRVYERHGCPETGMTGQEPPSGSLPGRVVPGLGPMRAGDLAACPWPPAPADRRRASACQCSTLATDRDSRPKRAYGRHMAVVRSTALSGHPMRRSPCGGRQRWVLQSAESS